MHFSLTGYYESFTVKLLSPHDIEEIEKRASQIPSEVLQKAKLLRVNLKNLNTCINDVLFPILGPRYQEIQAGGAYQFSKGERAFIAQIIEHAKNDKDEQLCAPIKHDLSAITTSTFLGILFSNNLCTTNYFKNTCHSSCKSNYNKNQFLNDQKTKLLNVNDYNCK